MTSQMILLKSFNAKFPDHHPPALCQIMLNSLLPHSMTFDIVDLYCDDLSCDCQKVTLVAHANNKTWATFAYGWKPYAFYREWGLDPETSAMLTTGFMDPEGTQSEYTSVLTDCFFQLTQDRQFIERIKQRYDLFKAKDNVINLKDKMGR